MQMLASKERKARKEHRCSLCSEIIRKGEVYDWTKTVSVKHDFKLVGVEIREVGMSKHSKRFYKVINPYVYYFGGGKAKIGLYRGERWELTSRAGNTVQITRSCVSMEISVRDFIEAFGEI